VIYQIVYPAQIPDHRGGTIVRWHKEPGDRIRFGDDLFDVEVDQIVVLQRTTRAALIARSSRKTKRLKNEYEERTSRRTVTVRVTASEPQAHLREIFAPEGARIRTGDLVAHATTTEHEPFPPDVKTETTSPFRAVVNILDPAG
jgi:ADP-heptose:LPS heptosyltransferase